MPPTIDHPTLCRYLSRSVTAGNLIHSDTLDDDLRMIDSIGALFLGRAADYWKFEPEEEHFALCKSLAEKAHALNPEIILQGCIFEAIYPGVENIPIPLWVFQAFNLPVETRNFRYTEITGPVFAKLFNWGSITSGSSGSCPDITRTEAQLWFYYRAVRYLQSGFEALHMGQVHMYAGHDSGYLVCRSLFEKIRDYASQNARRNFVLLDAHTHGIVHDGKLLFDFHSRPLSARNHLDRPEKILLVSRGRSEGGLTPSGWSCETLPTLIEVDNWGGYSMPPEKIHDPAARAQANRWGYDDIAWFAHQSHEDRNHFLEYAHHYTALQNPDAFFQMPIRRTLGKAPVTLPNKKIAHYFKANATTPDGFHQEETIKKIWNQPTPFHTWNRTHVGGINASDPAYKIPETAQHAPPLVSIVGDIQKFFGGIPGDASCPWSKLIHTGRGLYHKNAVLPWAGTFTFNLACGGTNTERLFSTALAGGPPYSLTIPRDNTVVRFSFDYSRKKLLVDNLQNAQILLDCPLNLIA